MQIVALTKGKNRRDLIPTDKTFESFAEVQNYCLEYGSKMNPMQDSLVLKFEILDSSERFDVVISWYEDGEAYVMTGFPEPRLF